MNLQLKEALFSDLSLSDIMKGRMTLVQFAREGGRQEDAVAVLEELRQSSRLPEDVVLDLLDIATGWCSPHLRVWNEDDPHVTKASD